MQPPLIWAITDDRPGNRTQVIGVANNLGWEYEEKNVRYSKLASLPHQLLGSSTMGIDRAHSDALTPPWPDIVIAAGRRLIPVMKYIKKRNKKAFLCYLMHPHSALPIFDLVAIPHHDAPPDEENVIATTGTPHQLTQQIIKSETKKWHETFSSFPRPYIVLLIGGDSSNSRFSDNDWYRLAYHSSAIAERSGGSVLATTSRRTSAQGLNIVRLALHEPNFVHEWQSEEENPYKAMIGAADAIVVTGESMSMCSEACISGQPVFIYDSQGSSSPKHKLLHEKLYDLGYARPLNADSSLEWTPPAPLDESARIAQAIKERLNL